MSNNSQDDATECSPCPPSRTNSSMGREPGWSLEWMKDHYKSLRSDCVEKWWTSHALPIKVGCLRVTVNCSLAFECGPITGWSLKRASHRLQTIADQASNWISSNKKSSLKLFSQHKATFVVKHICLPSIQSHYNGRYDRVVYCLMIKSKRF